MKIFIDSANLDEIKKAKSYGILDGVTTNPSLIKKAVERLKSQGKKINMESYIKEILKTARGYPVSLEVVGTSYDDMVKQGRKLFKKFNSVAKNVYIKIPINTSVDGKNNFEGLKAIKTLSKEKIPVNCTLIFTPEQALLAAKAGAKIVSPFVGRVDDYIRVNSKVKFEKSDYFPWGGMMRSGKPLNDNGVVAGIDLVYQIKRIFDLYKINSTEVLAASIRNSRQAREAALVGADISTLPLGVIEELLSHAKTREGVKNFSKDVVKEYENLF